jgi:hypothetical protein
MVNFILNSTSEIRQVVDKFTWSLVVVYGAAQDEHKEAFQRELVDLAKDNLHPIFIGGVLIYYDSAMKRARAGLCKIKGLRIY